MFSSKTFIETSKPHSTQGKQTAFFQPKLTVNEPGDTYEQEADAVADKVMRMPTPSVNSGQMQLKPMLFSQIQRKCADCEEKEKVQRKENGSGGGQAAPSIVNDVLASSGQPLDGGARQFMESRMGHDFSNVQIHTDGKAAKSVAAVNALAYTSGNHIVFNRGQYAPDTEGGKRLLAHELTHVVQQGDNRSNPDIQRTDWGLFGGSCCNTSSGVEWALVGNGEWQQLSAGECTSLLADCDGMTCGGGFYSNHGLLSTTKLLSSNLCRTPRQDSAYFANRRWTPTHQGSGALSPSQRGSQNGDTPPRYSYDVNP
jgi:hypothetical protein